MKSTSNAGTYCNLANSKTLVLILAGAPFDGGDEALPDALNKLGVGKGTFLLLRLNGGDYLQILSDEAREEWKDVNTRHHASPHCLSSP